MLKRTTQAPQRNQVLKVSEALQSVLLAFNLGEQKAIQKLLERLVQKPIY